MLYPVRKRRDINGHLIVNGDLYMGPFLAAPARIAMYDRTTGNLTALTTLGALGSQTLTLLTLSLPLDAATTTRIYGLEDGPYLFRQGLQDIRLYLDNDVLSGEFSSAKVCSSPPYAVSQVGNYGLLIEAASSWAVGDAFTYTAVEFMP
jgi:hypothetical protein